MSGYTKEQVEVAARVMRAAAAKLREMATAATPGPWRVSASWTTGGECPETVRTVTTLNYPDVDVAGFAIDTEDAGCQGGITPSNAAWIALMGTDKAGKIAAVLEDAATEALEVGPNPHILRLAKAFTASPVGEATDKEHQTEERHHS